jgi:hypothetical protein
MINSGRMKWAGHVARVGERGGEVYTRFWWANLKERNHVEGPGIDRWIILKSGVETGAWTRLI